MIDLLKRPKLLRPELDDWLGIRLRLMSTKMFRFLDCLYLAREAKIVAARIR